MMPALPRSVLSDVEQLWLMELWNSRDVSYYLKDPQLHHRWVVLTRSLQRWPGQERSKMTKEVGNVTLQHWRSESP